jgi:hypothetical protein
LSDVVVSFSIVAGSTGGVFSFELSSMVWLSRWQGGWSVVCTSSIPHHRQGMSKTVNLRDTSKELGSLTLECMVKLGLL